MELQYKFNKFIQYFKVNKIEKIDQEFILVVKTSKKFCIAIDFIIFRFNNKYFNSNVEQLKFMAFNAEKINLKSQFIQKI